MEKHEKLFNYLINLSFFLYFIILISERLISVIASINNGINLYGNGFNGYTYSLVFISIGAWLIYSLIYCRNNIKALFSKNSDIKFDKLCIASGILLISGMVHTEYTIPVIQFISYGILIIGILLKVIILNKTSNNRTILWLSFAYLVSLSMTIPVMYHSNIELHVLFHALEGIASVLLVAVFSYLLLLIFEEKEDLFILWPIIIAIVLDLPLIILRWNEEINYFVLIFLALSISLFIVGYLIRKIKKLNE